LPGRAIDDEHVDLVLVIAECLDGLGVITPFEHIIALSVQYVLDELTVHLLIIYN
jgi:hypothetical protein